jgi:hypothetical protein
MRPLVALALLASCGSRGYYVADLFQDGSGNLVMRKCAIDENDHLQPDDCFDTPVATQTRVTPTTKPVDPPAATRK